MREKGRHGSFATSCGTTSSTSSAWPTTRPSACSTRRQSPTTMWQRLAEYVTAGHGLAIFLGRNARPVDSFNGPAAQQVLPGPLRRQWRAETFLAPHNLQHPVLKKFRAVEGSIPWQAFPVFKYWQLGTLAPGVSEVRHPGDRPPGTGRNAARQGPCRHDDHARLRSSRTARSRSVEPAPHGTRRTVALCHPEQRTDALSCWQQPGAVELPGRRDGCRAARRRRAGPHGPARNARRRPAAAVDRPARACAGGHVDDDPGQLPGACRRRGGPCRSGIQRQSASRRDRACSG